MKNMHKKSILLLIAVALMLVGAVGGTLAYLIDDTDPVTNTFTPAFVGVEVTDSTDGTSKKDVDIENTSNIPVFLRVAVVANWCVDDDIVAAWNDYEGIKNAIGFDSSKWTNDYIYFYYNGEVAAETVVRLFDNYTPTKAEGIPDNAKLQMDIIAQVIQADGIGETTAQAAFADAATK